MTFRLSVNTPVGTLALTQQAGALIRIDWSERFYDAATDLLCEARRQLDAYFEGTLQQFDLPLCLGGSPFQVRVCQEMLKIPYGHTWTYGDIARNLHTSAQPVGGACGRNPLPIVVPCHRVLGAGDSLTGYSGGGGIATKQALLQHEGWRPAEPDMFATSQ